MDEYTDLEIIEAELRLAVDSIRAFRDAVNRLPPEIKAALIEQIAVADPDPRQAQLPDREKGLPDRENRPL